MGRAPRIVGSCVVVAALLLAATGCDLLPGASAAPADVIVLGLGADADGVEVPMAILHLQATGDVTVRAVDPLTRVTVPGTSYDTLRDAYPFGGGRGVSQALARTQGSDVMPFVALSLDDTVGLITEAGGVEVTLESGLNAFAGGALYSLPPGTGTYANADLRALLLGMDYLEGAERTQVSAAVAEALARALGSAPSATDALADGGSSTDLNDDALSALADRLKGATVEFEGFSR